MSKLKYFIKNNKYLFRVFEFFYFYVLVAKIKMERYFYSPFLLLPLSPFKVIGSSYIGQPYGDNPGAIIDELHRRNPEKFKCYWIVNDDKELEHKFPKYVRPLKIGTASYYYHMSTAKFWIDNSRKDRYPIKRKNQVYLQTWHGGISFKKIEKDAEDKLPKYYLYCAKRDSRAVDLMISNSSFQTNMIRESFWYDGEILKVGTPRLDKLVKQGYSPTKIENLKKEMNIEICDKVILYAPTFRKGLNSEAYIKDLDAIRGIYGTNSKLIVKIHPNMSFKDYRVHYNGNIISPENNLSIYTLMTIADILITDYSSTMFEFAMLKKPVFLIAKDYTSYLAERGSYFEVDELPFKICFTENELLSTMKNFNYIEYCKQVDSFFDKIDLYENGTACTKVVDKLLLK